MRAAAPPRRYTRTSGVGRTILNTILYYVQPAAVTLIIEALPPVFTGISMFEGVWSWSKGNMMQMRRYFWFQVINVFFAITLSGSLQARASPESRVRAGAVVVGVSVFSHAGRRARDAPCAYTAGDRCTHLAHAIDDGWRRTNRVGVSS